MKKYELTEETLNVFGYTLHRIRALKDFSDVQKGDLGGWVERKENLSQKGNAWVHDNAWVCDNARVCDNAWVCGDARVRDNARVCGDALVYGNALVCGDAQVCDNALVCGDAYIYSCTAILTIGPIGSRNDTTTFFNRKDGNICVACGCFRGNIDEFAAAVQKTHGNNQFATRYKLAIELARAAIETKIWDGGAEDGA